MPTFSRTYTDDWVTKYVPSIVWRAKQIEGNSHVQTTLEQIGATQDEDGIYQMDSIPVKEQYGILIDYWAWKNHRNYTITMDAEAAKEAAAQEVQDDFEHGGVA